MKRARLILWTAAVAVLVLAGCGNGSDPTQAEGDIRAELLAEIDALEVARVGDHELLVELWDLNEALQGPNQSFLSGYYPSRTQTGPPDFMRERWAREIVEYREQVAGFPEDELVWRASGFRMGLGVQEGRRQAWGQSLERARAAAAELEQ